MLSIGKFAKECGVGVETVRFYQRKGLLDLPSQINGMRRYSEDDLRQLKFIRKAQVAGFTLNEIKELLALNSTNDRVRARELAISRVSELDEKITQLKSARDSLRKLAKECKDSSSGPCPILKAFDI